jgi:hypothetical protein
MGIAIVGLILNLHTADAQLPIRPTGIFSDMRYVKEAGDVVGTEIFVTYGDGEYWAQVQHAEGEPGAPHLAKVNVQGTKVSFELAFDETHIEILANRAEQPKIVHYLLHFEGEVSKDRLVGKFNDSETLDLKRRNSYWQQ